MGRADGAVAATLGAQSREDDLRRFGRGNREDGAALVETALVLPLLFMLTVGIWTTARAWNVHNTLDHAAREAARYGATVADWPTYDDATAVAAVLAIANQELSAASIDTTTVSSCIEMKDDPCSLTATGTPQVGVTLSTVVDLEFVLFKIPNVTLKASAVARWEGSVAGP